MSRRSGPGGGKTSTPDRANSARICSSARRTVAVDATIFGRTVCPSTFASHSASIAVSYSPAIVPSGPEIRCSSSWMIRSGGGSGVGQLLPDAGVARHRRSHRVVPIRATEQRATRADPRQARELVDRGDHEARHPPVDRLVDRDDRQRVLALERARQVAARRAGGSCGSIRIRLRA